MAAMAVPAEDDPTAEDESIAAALQLEEERLALMQ